MILALDIGNTNTVLGLFRGSLLVFQARVSTSNLETFLSSRKWNLGICDGGIISSVVPQRDKAVKKILKNRHGLKQLIVVSHRLKLPIRLKVKKPSEVGADRIVNDSYAFLKYKGPLCVIDFGTATTIDYINRRGDYRGGVILPGLRISAEALFTKAAKLKDVPFIAPKKVLGKTTQAQLQSGLMGGHAAMVDCMIEKIWKEVGHKTKVVATGGLSPLLAPHLTHLHTIDPHLTLKGLELLYALNS